MFVATEGTVDASVEDLGDAVFYCLFIFLFLFFMDFYFAVSIFLLHLVLPLLFLLLLFLLLFLNLSKRRINSLQLFPTELDSMVKFPIIGLATQDGQAKQNCIDGIENSR